jgi:glycosyltransferase involved in cell wall biosynthesis
MKTKVAFMNSHEGWGGGEKWHFEAACYFYSIGYDVTFICRHGSVLHKKLLDKEIFCQFIKVTNLSFLNPYKLFLLNSLLKKASVLLVNSPADNKLAGVSTLFNKKLKIVLRRGMPHPIKPSVLNRWLFRTRINHVIANSETVKESLNSRSDSLIPKDNISIIYNGFDIEAYNKKSVEPLQFLNETAPVLVSCGRLVEQKNHMLLLRAAKILKDKGENFQLIIVGEGALHEELESYISKHRLNDVCVLSGFMENIKDILNCASLFLLPSFYEGSSNALIEACGVGLPAIVSNIASNSEIVDDGVNGFLLPIDKPEKWADKISELLSDQKKLSAFGVNSKDKMMSDFSILVNRKKLKELVDSLN